MMMVREHDGRQFAAIGLIALGALIFLGQLTGTGGMFHLLWPLFVAAPGFAFLYFAFNGDKNVSGLAVPGTVITGTGLILFYQNLTGNWASWAYAWTLYPLFVGLAMRFMAQRTESAEAQKASSLLMKIGSIGFIIGAMFFELVIFNHGGIFGSLALPVLLVVFGAFLLFGNKKAAYANGYISKQKYSEFYPNGNGKYKNSDRLQQQIDEALAEDDHHDPVV